MGPTASRDFGDPAPYFHISNRLFGQASDFLGRGGILGKAKNNETTANTWPALRHPSLLGMNAEF